MYLADTEIRARLEELDFGVPAGYAPFDEDAQIQPCSVDLRLGPRFWVARSRVSFDVRRHRLLELAPRRWWKEYNVAAGRSITLKPGGMLLGHVLERFQLPAGGAGRIQGRSSYARLGLMVHCAADFINPGWRGRFPLQLINLGKAPIKLYPGLPICQLLLVKVHGTVARPYGHAELGSLYVEDDGGPSFWWRDRLLR